MTTLPQIARLSSGDPAGAARWDAFVDACPSATFFHRAGWQRVLREVFRHDTWFLYAETDGHIEGVLPLAQVKSLLFGHSLVSLPFAVYGGVAATNEAAADALEQEAQRLARELGAAHLELRNVGPRHTDWPRQDLYVTFRKELLVDDAANMQSIPRKQRAMVRKGIKNGLVSTIDDGVDRFFALYADNVHRHGTPALPKRYFETLREVFGADCEVLTVSSAGGQPQSGAEGHVEGQAQSSGEGQPPNSADGQPSSSNKGQPLNSAERPPLSSAEGRPLSSPQGRPLSSVMSFYFRDEVLPYYAGDAEAARDLAANDFKYWELMRHAAARGVKLFDYGRSKQGTGSFAFKKNWGFEPQPLHYEYCLYKRDTVPQNNPSNAKYKLLIEAWRRMPIAVANRLGPWVVRGLG